MSNTTIPNDEISEAELYGQAAGELRDRNRELRAELADARRTIATLERRLARTSPARIAPLRKTG
jgi:hypothetical protein